MARGRGCGKSSGRSNPAIHVSMRTIPMPSIVSSQQGGTPNVETSAQNTTPAISETPPVTPNQSNTVDWNLLKHARVSYLSLLEMMLIPMESIGKVSQTIQEMVILENSSESEVKRHWLAKAAINYKSFISKIKGEGIRLGYIPEHVWERWMELWGSDECIKKSEINAKNRRTGHETAAGTHTGRSISMGEYRKKLLHLHAHMHGHDGKSFVDERSRIVHEKYEEILREKTVSQADIDQSEAFYQAVGGEKKRRIYGLGSEAKSYYGQKLSASSSVLPSISQSTSITNMDEFVKQMLPAVTNHFLPVVMGRVQEGSTPIDNPSTVTPLVPLSATTNEGEVDP
ncbi:hypothetical protein R3W88_027192 [Solanum pinnatisectum]|uniref:Uncharacterized protein n=1 Tax=Solanum pinnatisectum TaxID=50273 RepID=A0AAV9LG31_9SOLN|nr:hypothetical protein R3W88_027192 [Solanum pinnatisectum]